MRDKAKLLFALALAGALISPAAAEDYIMLNGLPCGSFCRMWMGVKLPSETPPQPQEAPVQTPDAEAPPPRREANDRRPPAHRAPKPAKITRAAAPRPQTAIARRATGRPAPSVVAAAPIPSPVVSPSLPSPPPAVAGPSPTAVPTPTEVAKPAPAATGDAKQVASLAPGGQPDRGRLVAIVMTKLDVQGVSDLHDKSIVLAGDMNLSDERLKAAFEIAGADRATFKQGDVKDADEVESGAVAAAIVAVVPPEIARAFPEIPGYRLLRVEVSP